MKPIPAIRVWSVHTLAVILALSLCHCGDESGSSPFDGFYETVVHQIKQPCDAAWEDQTVDQKYFKLETTEMLGVKILARYECTTDSQSSCSERMSLFESMSWDQGQWAYEITTSSYVDECQLSRTHGIPQLNDIGFDIELENQHTVVESVSQDNCGTDLVDTIPAADFACKFMELFENKRLE